MKIADQTIRMWIYPKDANGNPASNEPYLEITLKFDCGYTHQQIQAIVIEELKRNIEELKKAGIE